MLWGTRGRRSAPAGRSVRTAAALVRLRRRVDALSSLGREEHGMVAVWFAILALFVFFGFAFFVVNLSNTHEHRRHLQVQVDDGALASGSFFTGCFQAPDDANKNIAAQALTFAGDPQLATDYDKLFPGGTPPPGPFNQQVQDASRVRIRLNSASYATSLADAFDPTNGPLNGTDFSLGMPCDAKFLDVKASDIDVPTPFAGLVPAAPSSVDVKARARVEIKKVKILSGFLPWAVPDIEPKAVAAIFVDEDDGSVQAASFLTAQNLDANGNPVPQALNGTSLTVWAGDLMPAVVPGTGLIVLTSQKASPSLSGTLADICGQTAVKCTAGGTATSGVDFVHGFPSTSSGIVLRGVTLEGTAATGCTDDSAPYFQWTPGCTFKLVADLDLSGVPGTPTVKAFGSGCPNSGCQMSLQNGLWRTGNLSVADGSGRNVYDMKVDVTTTGGGQPVTTTGTFQNVQHVFAATDDASANGYSSPVEFVRVSQGATFANSLPTGTQAVHVEVGLLPPLHVTSADEPPILLRFASKSGSLNQALDCDASPRTLAVEVAEGCHTQYAVNERDGDCSGWTTSNLPPATFVPDPIPDCIQAKTGDVTAMAQGLHDRFEVPYPVGGCPPNNWRTFRDQGTLPPPTDPRWVSLVVTDFSAFSGQGASVVPITKFAGFYVTGWFVGAGGQGTQGCAQNDLPPPPLCPTWPDSNGSAGCDPSTNAQKGNVWGYFVTNVILGPAGTSNDLCAFNEVGLCVAVLTE
jgi:hypothetical protein